MAADATVMNEEHAPKPATLNLLLIMLVILVKNVPAPI